MNANATKDHLVDVAKRVGVTSPAELKKDDLVTEIEKANARETARARR